MGTVAKLKDEIPDWDNDDATLSYTEDAVLKLIEQSQISLESACMQNSVLVENYGDEYTEVSPITKLNAYNFIDLFNSEITVPEISINKDGRVYFEWYNSKDSMLGVIIGDKIINNDYVLHYSAIYGSNNQEMGMKPISGIGIVDIIFLLNKLTVKVADEWATF